MTRRENWYYGGMLVTALPLIFALSLPQFSLITVSVTFFLFLAGVAMQSILTRGAYALSTAALVSAVLLYGLATDLGLLQSITLLSTSSVALPLVALVSFLALAAVFGSLESSYQSLSRSAGQKATSKKEQAPRIQALIEQERAFTQHHHFVPLAGHARYRYWIATAWMTAMLVPVVGLTSAGGIIPALTGFYHLPVSTVWALFGVSALVWSAAYGRDMIVSLRHAFLRPRERHVQKLIDARRSDAARVLSYLETFSELTDVAFEDIREELDELRVANFDRTMKAIKEGVSDEELQNILEAYRVLVDDDVSVNHLATIVEDEVSSKDLFIPASPDRESTQPQSKWPQYARLFGSAWGTANALIANMTGLLFSGLAIAGLLASGATLPLWLVWAIAVISAMAGFGAAFALTRKSLQNNFESFVQWMIAKRQKQESETPSMRRKIRPHAWRNNFLYVGIGLALVMSTCLAIFNWVAGAHTLPDLASKLNLHFLSNAPHALNIAIAVVAFTLTVASAGSFFVTMVDGQLHTYKNPIRQLKDAMKRNLTTPRGFLKFAVASIVTGGLTAMLWYDIAMEPTSLFIHLFGGQGALVFGSIVAPVIFALAFSMFYMGTTLIDDAFASATSSQKGYIFSKDIHQLYATEAPSPAYVQALKAVKADQAEAEVVECAL